MTDAKKMRIKHSLVTFSCVVLFMFLHVMIIINGRAGESNINGVFVACQFAACLMLIQQDNRRGSVLSEIMLCISFLYTLSIMLVHKNYSVIPGLCNYIIYITAIYLLAHQFRIRKREAVTDMLTGLINRRGIYNLLESKTLQNKEFYVIYIDLVDFKFINDLYGHLYGDRILKIVADKINSVICSDGTAGRMDGDEFVVILDKGKSPIEISNTIIQRISEKITVEIGGVDVDCFLSAYAGVSGFPKDSDNYEELLKYANIAMYHAAKQETEKVKLYDLEMHKYINRRMEVENKIKIGLEKNLFYMMYQPQYDISGKILRGFEALVRLKDDEGQIIGPDEFIPIAEDSDLIFRIDNYVIDRVLREFKSVCEKGYVVSVNVSAKNIGCSGFAERVKLLLEQYEFPADKFEIEITEYCMARSIDATIDNISKLREFGVHIALDDFGTGYTSLSYLSKLPINLLKIDKSLVDNIESSDKNSKFVNTVISLGHLMGCKVISEGVECDRQVELLNEYKCDLIQGYVWSRPLMYEDAVKLS